MVTATAILLVVHGLIHLLGVAKAFGWAELPQLTQPISPVLGILWLVSALLFLAAALSLFLWPRGWWLIGAGAVVVSMLVILPSWADAKVGAYTNAVLVVGLVFGFLSQPCRARLLVAPGRHDRGSSKSHDADRLVTVRSGDGEDRAGRAPDDVLGRRAEHPAVEGVPAVDSQHDQVGVPVCRDPENLVAGLSALARTARSKAWRENSEKSTGQRTRLR
jgi:hypothetical protein